MDKRILELHNLARESQGPLPSCFIAVAPKEASIKYVRTEGEEGVQKSTDFADSLTEVRTRGRRERGSKNPNVLNGSSLRDTKLSVGIHMYLGYVSTASLCHFCLRSLTPPTKDLECPLRKEYCPYSGGHLQIDFESCNIFEIAKKRAFI